MESVTTKEPGSAAWPGAFGIFDASRKAVTANLGVIAPYIVISVLVSAATGRIGQHGHPDLGSGLLQSAVSLLVGAAFTALGTVLFLQAAKGKKVNLSWAIERAVQIFPKVLVLYLALYVVAIGSLILLVVPFLIFAFFIMPRLVLTPYFVADEDKNMGPFQAVAASWHATRGNVGKVWGLIGATIVFVLPVLTIVGILLTIYLAIMYSAAYALLYLYLLEHGSEQPAGTWTPPTSAAPADTSKA